ncbi:DNA repair protein XRCC4 [Capsicum annuum]|nr:DNA repair protein XRCC4 [Capsicum annuum]
MGSASPKQTCLKLEIPNNKDKIFVKGTWYPSYFQLFITDGLHAWTCHGSEEEVEERALQWDQPVSEYIELAEKYLGFQQPDSVYGFDDAGSGHKRDWAEYRSEARLLAIQRGTDGPPSRPSLKCQNWNVLPRSDGRSDGPQKSDGPPNRPSLGVQEWDILPWSDGPLDANEKLRTSTRKLEAYISDLSYQHLPAQCELVKHPSQDLYNTLNTIRTAMGWGWVLSWTFEKEGTKLEWRWKCQPSPNSQKTTADILDFLMDANIRLSDEVVDKTQSFERLRVEADKCLTQSEILSKEKEEFESAIYAKFVGVLNSKKKKLRELRDRLSKQGTSVEEPVEEDAQSTDRTETFDEGSNEEISGEEVEKEDVGTSSKKDDVGTSNPRRGRGRKRK